MHPEKMYGFMVMRGSETDRIPKSSKNATKFQGVMGVVLKYRIEGNFGE